MLIAMMILGLLLVILMMVFIVNPPEAWIKKFYHRDDPNKNDKTPQ
jgi:hypothetical protein